MIERSFSSSGHPASLGLRVLRSALEAIPLVIFLFFYIAFPDSLLIPGAFPCLYHGVLYFLILNDPRSLSFPVLLIASLFIDIATGQKIGISFFEFLLFVLGVLCQRHQLIKAPFSMVWFGFAFFLFCLTLGAQIVLYFQGKTLASWTVLKSYVLVVLSYPLLSWFLMKVHRFTGGEDPADNV